jgi:demethylmenaquinone methyltransferase/2-methoxy-6-polyprenyl-1,4-benzoquinol methylase
VTWFLCLRYDSSKLRVEGLDCSAAMLSEASRRHPLHTFTHGDVCALPYADASFDAVTTVFTLRNFPDRDAGLREMLRVLRPGGALVIIDAFPPKAGVFRRLLALWLNWVVPALAAAVSRRGAVKAYRYLAASIQQTADVEGVADALRAAGAAHVRVSSYTFGAAARLIATKA